MVKSTPKRGPARVRYDLDDQLPDLLTQAQVIDLLRKKFGEAPGYVKFREMVEADLIPSCWSPFHAGREFRHRRYRWADVCTALYALTNNNAPLQRGANRG